MAGVNAAFSLSKTTTKISICCLSKEEATPVDVIKSLIPSKKRTD